MANATITNRDGSTTIISDSYAPFGEAPVAPVRPENPDLWRPATLDGPATCKRYGATIEELFAWQDLIGFPKPCKNAQLAPTPGTFSIRRVYAWDPSELAAFDARIRAMYQRLPKK